MSSRPRGALGVSSLNRELNSYGLSLTLGGGEVALLDHTYAFSVFANGGVMAGQPVPADRQRPGYRKLDPVFILKVEDKEGKMLEEFTDAEPPSAWWSRPPTTCSTTC